MENNTPKRPEPSEEARLKAAQLTAKSVVDWAVNEHEDPD